MFGDIDIQAHRDWVHKVCNRAGLQPLHPLWQEGRESLIREIIETGFKATIVVVKEGALGKDYLGRVLTLDLIEEFAQLGIDVAGEQGEYHTVVTDGPIFTQRLELSYGNKEHNSGYWFLRIADSTLVDC